MRSTPALLLVAFVLVGCGAGSALSVKQAASPRFAGAELHPLVKAPAFTLADAHGRRISLAAQRGRMVLVTFLYTHCPDVCPLIASHLNEAVGRLGLLRQDVRVLAISVDPKGDSAKAVRAYERLHRLRPQFHYLIGSRPQLAPVWADYHVAVQAGNLDSVDHTAYTVLVDRGGLERVIYDARVQPGQVVHDVKVLAKERRNG